MLSWLRAIWSASTPTTPPVISSSSVTANGADPADAWQLLALVNDWVKHGETKLGVVAAFLGVLAAGLISLALANPHPSCLMLTLDGLAGVGLLAALGSACIGLLPRHPTQSLASEANLLDFGDVSTHYRTNTQGYTMDITRILGSSDELVGQISRQVVANSAVAQRKFVWANRAILLGLVATALTAAVAVGQVLSW